VDFHGLEITVDPALRLIVTIRLKKRMEFISGQVFGQESHYNDHLVLEWFGKRVFSRNLVVQRRISDADPEGARA